MKRQAWQDLRLRFVISHSLVAGQLYSIFPAIKHRNGHPGTGCDALILPPSAACVCCVSAHSFVHTHTHRDHSCLMMTLTKPSTASGNTFQKKSKTAPSTGRNLPTQGDDCRAGFTGTMCPPGTSACLVLHPLQPGLFS